MPPTTPAAKLRQSLSQARAQTDSLFDLIDPAALYERPIPERHRIIFYLGHLEAFDWNLLGPALDLPAFHPAFDQLFSFGIDPDSTALPTDQPADWPAETEVRDYNARVRHTLDATLAHAPGELLHVAIEHRLMHAETFAYILHNLAYEKKTAQSDDAAVPRRRRLSGPAWSISTPARPARPS